MLNPKLLCVKREQHTLGANLNVFHPQRLTDLVDGYSSQCFIKPDLKWIYDTFFHAH